ncbi:MAG: hypothetical protein ACLSUZ_00940 [Bifidobacterium pseudocatenulatum]
MEGTNTVRTHYEGHPPLWWMLLAIPAKLGMPYEIGLKSLNLMCAALMIWLLEFKTKLPELLKVILPFSYFLCYQYGVTSRPYALMIAAMLLIAINWNNRNTKPWPVILSMMLLCATSSYGLAIAGMLALNWTIQFLCGERSLIKNKQRFAGLVLLLVFAIILLLNVLPAPGTYHGDFDIHGTATTSPAWVSVFNTWLVMPSETLFTSTLSDGNMQFIALTPSELFMPCVMSCLMWCFLIQICLRRKTASLLLTTYLGISVAFTAHLSMHHAGIILGFFIAILAIDCDIEKINSNDWPQWIRNLNNRVMTLLGPKKTERYLRFFKILGLIFMLVSVYWTASASICDIRYDYSSSRAVASFIKTNHLEQYRWMAGWTRVSKNDTASNPEINKIIDEGGYCGGTDCIDYTSWYGSTLIDSAPYFDHTLLANAYKGRSYSSWEWCVDPMRERKTSKHGNRGANPNSTTLCISHFSSPTLVTTETITRKSKSPKPRHLGKAHGRKAPAKFTCATTFTRTYCIRPILESTGPTAQRADNKWTGIQLERVDCSFMQNVPLSAPLYRLDMLCTCRGASGESGS